MPGTVPDRFSYRAERYARVRPAYPDLLLQWLRSKTVRGERCWDVGTGSGQVAGLAASYYEQVYATDVSSAQLSQAVATRGVTYAVESAERSSLPDHSVDAVLVGAAAHWFDLPAFYTEVRRVCRPGGLLALFSYGTRPAGQPALQAVIDRYVRAVLAPWWSDRLAMVESAYQTVAFPFREYRLPPFSAVTVCDLQGFEELLSTWSAAQLMARETGEDPLESVRSELHQAWGDPAQAGEERMIRWPIFARVGRVGGA